jgi:phage terminase large subunit-like protein
VATPPAAVAVGVRLACERHLADLRQAPARGYSWSPDHARWAIGFFAFLTHWKGRWSGQPFTLEPFQAFIVGSLWGWRDRRGRRRYRKAWIELTRKQGKSTLAAGILLLATFFSQEAGAEGYCVATARRQARIVFDCCRQFVLRSRALRGRFVVGQHAIAHDGSSSKIETISKDTPQQHGLNASVAVMDETHAYRTADLMDVVETSMGSREDPLVVYTTTAGVGQESIGWRLHDYTLKMLQGILPRDDGWFGFIAGAEPADDWTAPATWKKANLNLGVSVRIDFLRAEARKAREVLTAQNAFKRFYLNLWVEQAERWIDVAAWDRSSAPPAAFGTRPVFGGLDLAATRDLASLVWIAEDGGAVDVRARFWIPASVLRKRKDEVVQVSFRQWIADGRLTVAGDDVLDYAAIRAAILEDVAAWRVVDLRFDPWNAVQLAGELEAEGIVVVPVRPGYPTLHDPTSALGERVVAGTLRHGGHPILRWNAANMVIGTDADGRIKPDRKRATDKIDGVYALILALDGLNRSHDTSSAYDDHDLIIVEPSDDVWP